ncbi:unnamed protein product [Urochloa decumbens]|uniref:RING-type E3 ubiquitin transferase n=1 Tax=Urochloa decumbens TaxID=240449 RepID=A0ABC8ZI15_9POAL
MATTTMTAAMSTTTVKASDPGSAWFGSGARTPPSAGAGGHNVRLITTAVGAFVSVLGLALFLHLYVCHVRRRNRRRAEAAAAVLPITSAAPAKCGLDAAAIAALPTAVYGGQAAAEGEPGAECAICLGAVQEGEVVRALPACGHVFHVPCVDTWLASSSSCPVCRAEVEPPAQEEGAAARLVLEKLQDAAAKEAEEAAAGSCSSTPERGTISACASLMKMLSRERPAAPRRPQQSAAVHADAAGELDDLERQMQAVNN